MKKTLIDAFEHSVLTFPDNTFLLEKVGKEWTRLTYKEVQREVYRFGAGLQALGVRSGDNMALLSEGRNLWIISELAMFYAGAVNVPLSIKLEEAGDLLFRLDHSDARYIIVSGNQLRKVRGIIDRLPRVERVIVLDSQAEYGPKEIYVGEVLQQGDRYIEEKGLEQMLSVGRKLQNDTLATITYTSGTTADPKGVCLTHRNYTANVAQGNSVISIGPDSTMLIILPLDHCFAHVAGMYTMMGYAGSIAFVPIGKNALATLRNVPAAIAETRPHVMLSVPALARNFKKNIEAGIKKKGPKVEKLFNFAVQNAIKYNKEYYNRGTGGTFWRKPLVALFDKILFKQVRESFGGRMQFFVGGGALLDIELQRFFCAVGMPMFQGYGLTEATPIICANSAGHARFGSSGRLVKPMDIVILDAEGKEVPHGTRGEIVIRGENVMAGYWKNPKATADTIIDGWLHTGDMGYICPEDPEFLYVVGRFKSLLISSDGEKYSPEGFEDNLTEVSKFVNACVLHNNQKPYCVALIVPDKAALKEAVEAKGLDAASEEGRKAMVDIIQQEVDSYKKGGKHEGMFPERWLPTAVGICDEEFTIANKMMNSTMKIVRGKVEEHYASLLDYLYTAEGKDIKNPRNLEALK